MKYVSDRARAQKLVPQSMNRKQLLEYRFGLRYNYHPSFIRSHRRPFYTSDGIK